MYYELTDILASEGMLVYLVSPKAISGNVWNVSILERSGITIWITAYCIILFGLVS